MAFSALAIMNGEKLFPGYVIDVQEILINGEPHEMTGKGYTCTDNGLTTRVNLFNEWVGKGAKPGSRMHYNDTTDASPTLINRNAPEVAKIRTITVTFEYGPKKTR